MSVILSLVAKDFRLFWKDKIAVLVSFLVPMVLMTIFGLVFGGGGGSGAITVMVVDQSQTAASRQMVEALQSEGGLNVVTTVAVREGESERTVPLTEELARQRLATDADRWRFLVVVPEDFVKEDFGFRLRYIYNPRSNIQFEIVTGLLQRTFFANLLPFLQESFGSSLEENLGPGGVDEFQNRVARAVSEAFGIEFEEVRRSFPEGSLFPVFGAAAGADGEAGAGEDGESSPARDPFSILLDLDDEQIAGKGKPVEAQYVGAWSVMFLLFTMAGAASALFEERDHGVFHRLLSGPVSGAHILWSKYLHLTLLGFLQLVVLFAYGQVVFRIITSLDQLLPLAVLGLFGALASTAFGMVLCSFCRNPAQASGLSTLLILSMSALGGAMLPAFMFPAFIRDYLTPFTLVHWMIDGMLQILWEDASLPALWLNLALLGTFALLALLLALWRFRRSDLFR
jgi:ABC-2 type transport system permease protein